MCKKVYQMNELIESHIKLVPFLVNKYFYTKDHHTKEELISIGYEALVVAAKKYDPEKSMFSTFAGLKIRSAIAKYFIQKANRERIAPSFSIDFEREGGTTWHELVEDGIARYEDQVVFQLDLEQLLACLSEKEREIVGMFFGLEEEEPRYLLREIGEKIGVSADAARQRKDKALKKLRAEVLAG